MVNKNKKVELNCRRQDSKFLNCSQKLTLTRVQDTGDVEAMRQLDAWRAAKFYSSESPNIDSWCCLAKLDSQHSQRFALIDSHGFYACRLSTLNASCIDGLRQTLLRRCPWTLIAYRQLPDPLQWQAAARRWKAIIYDRFRQKFSACQSHPAGASQAQFLP